MQLDSKVVIDSEYFFRLCFGLVLFILSFFLFRSRFGGRDGELRARYLVKVRVAGCIVEIVFKVGSRWNGMYLI